jgi:hypothetical protein
LPGAPDDQSRSRHRAGEWRLKSCASPTGQIEGGASPRPSKRLVWISGLMLIAAGCVDPPAMSEAPAVTPPVPAGQARIWFPRLGALGEPQSREYRRQRQLFRVCRQWRRLLPRCFTRALPHYAPELRPRLQSRPGCRSRLGATGVLQRCVVAQLGRGRRRGGVRAGHVLYPAGATRGGTDRNPPEPQWYLRVWCAGSGSNTKASNFAAKRRGR